MPARRALTPFLLCASLAFSACATSQPSTGRRVDAEVSPARVSTLAESPTPEDTSSGSASSERAASRATHAPSQRAIGTGWGPTRREITRARRLVSRMTLDRLAGQVIVARYDGTGAPTSLVNGLHLGGVIAMAENIAGTDQLRSSNKRLQSAAADAGRRWPVFIGVDQEGGIVARVKDNATLFPTFMTAGAARAPELTSRAAAASGGELVDLGFTVVFAPDADVTSGPADPTIGSRSAGSRPRLVAAQVNAAVEGYGSAGIVPVVKHFPGHGSVPADSHLELPVQKKSLRELTHTDLVPFESAVRSGVSAVMAAHIDVRAVDPGVPSSLSRPVVTGLLRNRLGFQGLVVTDALDMRAVSDRFGSARSAVRALRAGADVLLMPPSPRAARDGIVQAVRRGSLARARLEQAASRQVALLLHQRNAGPAVGRRPGTSGTISQRFSAAAVTMVSGPCRGRLVGPSVRASGPPRAVARFSAAARRAGLRVGSGTTVALVGYRGAPRRADVVVSMDTPYVLAQSRARTARIAVYGDTPGAMRALVRVLLGKARAPGRLPVRVAGVPRAGCR